MSTQLSSGALKAINEGVQVDKPVFQILALKKLNPTTTTNNAVDRYRILLSDGIHNNSVMLAVQLNQMVTDGKLEPNTVVCLDRYVCNKLAGNRRVVIILEVTVVASANQTGGKIGNPVSLLSASGGSGSNGQTAPAPAPQQPMRTGASPMSVAKGSSFGGGGGNFGKPQSSFGGPGMSSGMSPPKQSQPISSLTPYQNRWTIKTRVSSKSAVRTWSNSRGEGKLFSMDLCDQSGEIRATAFKDQCDKFFDLIEVGKVYFISRGTLKTANRQYTSITNDYEMTFNNDTTVVPCEEEDDSIPTMQFDFRTIDQLEDMSKDSILDASGGDSVVVDSTTAVTKPTATITPVAAVIPTTASQIPNPQDALGHQMALIRPVFDVRSTNQQMLPAFPIFASQRVPGPSTNQQMFAIRGATPMIRVVHHHHAVPDPRGPPPQGTPTTVSSVTGTTSTTSSVTGIGQAFQIHFHHRPGYLPQPVIRFVQGGPPQGGPPQGGPPQGGPPQGGPPQGGPPQGGPPQGGPPQGGPPQGGPPQGGPPQGGPPQGGPPQGGPPQGGPPQGGPPQGGPSQGGPSPAPLGVNRCMHAHHGNPVFRTPTPATKAQPNPIPTSSTPIQQPTRCALHQGASVPTPGLPPRRPEPEQDNKPELAQLAQHIRNITSDVKTIKPGSRGVPLDPRQKQRMESAEATNNRRKEVKAKSKTLQTEDAKAATEDSSLKVQEPIPTDKTALGAEATGTSSSSSTDSTRRRKRRKRTKQHSPSLEEAGQDSALEEGKTSSEPGKEEPGSGKVNDDRTLTQPDTHLQVESELEPHSKHDDEEKLAYDSDDDISSESESEDESNLDADAKSTSEPTSHVASRSLSLSCTEKTLDQDQELEATYTKADGDSVSQSCSDQKNEPTEDAYPPHTRDHSESSIGQESITGANEEHKADEHSPKEVVSAETPESQVIPDPAINLQTSSEASPRIESQSAVKTIQETVSDTKAVDAKPKLSIKEIADDDQQKAVNTEPVYDSRHDEATPNAKSSHGTRSITGTESTSESRNQRATKINQGSYDRQQHNPELQQDRFDFEHRQLVLERKRLDCERQQILLAEERLQMEQDRLQTEREHLLALQVQVKLQQDQLELNRSRLELQRDHLEVDRDRLQVDRLRLQGEEQRGEDSKIILQSLQEISQALQMSVNLSLQGYGFPMSYDSDDGGNVPNTEYMQEQGYMPRRAHEGWPVEETNISEGTTFDDATSNLDEQPPDTEGEWTVVGGPRASWSQHQNAYTASQDRMPSEGALGTPALGQSGWPSEPAAPTLERSSTSTTERVQRSEETAKARAPGETSKGQRSGQRSGEVRRSSPVHGLSSIQERQETGQNPNRREHRQWRPDNRRGRNNERRLKQTNK